MWRIFPPWLFEKLHLGHRKSHFKRTQYWKHSSEKQHRNAVEPSKSNKYVALNCQTHEALIFKPFFPTKEPETCLSWGKGYRSSSSCLEASASLCPCARACVCCVYQSRVPHGHATLEEVILYCTSHKTPHFLFLALLLDLGRLHWHFVSTSFCIHEHIDVRLRSFLFLSFSVQLSLYVCTFQLTILDKTE